MLGEILNGLTDPATAEATLRGGQPGGPARRIAAAAAAEASRSARWSPARSATCSTMAARTSGWT